MSTDDKKQSNEWAFLGRVVAKTLVRDVFATAIGVCIGALLGVLVAYVMGYSVQSMAKVGALVGMAVAVASGSIGRTLFELGRPNADQDPKP